MRKTALAALSALAPLLPTHALAHHEELTLQGSQAAYIIFAAVIGVAIAGAAINAGRKRAKHKARTK